MLAILVRIARILWLFCMYESLFGLYVRVFLLDKKKGNEREGRMLGILVSVA